jgi:hypothetical protein
VFGPVPTVYRFVVWLCGLGVFAGLAAWISPVLPLATSVLATVGLALGAVAAFLFLHDFDHPHATAVRERRGRHR